MYVIYSISLNLRKIASIIHIIYNIQTGVGYIRGQFEGRNKNPREKQIYAHVTCATDKTNVEKVFGDVQHIVINTSLARGGLI